jgi:hypothetical protein
VVHTLDAVVVAPRDAAGTDRYVLDLVNHKMYLGTGRAGGTVTHAVGSVAVTA